MPGFAYVTLPDDKRVHVLAEDEQTKCGLVIPINAGAELLRETDEDLCSDCTGEKKRKKASDG